MTRPAKLSRTSASWVENGGDGHRNVRTFGGSSSGSRVVGQKRVWASASSSTGQTSSSTQQQTGGATARAFRASYAR